MKKADEEKLLAELYVQLGGSKRKIDDWISIAMKCEQLRREYGSTNEVAEKLGRSYQLIRTILSLLHLPKEVQQLISERKIGYDAAQRLYSINNPDKQIEVAKIIAQMPSHKAREIIRYAKTFPNASLEHYTRRVVSAQKPKTEKIHVAILPLRKEIYESLNEVSMKKKISLEKLILNIISEWVQKRRLHAK